MCLNSNEFCEVAEEYFKNGRITLEEKNKILKRLEVRKTNELFNWSNTKENNNDIRCTLFIDFTFSNMYFFLK